MDNAYGMSSAAAAAAEVQPRFGVFMSDVDQFDCAAFGISPLEASTMDPQQRLLLKAAAQAMPSASTSSQLLTGVYVGIGSNDYEVLASHAGVSVSAFSFTAASAAVASGRLAYVFGLQGPSASIDTACSASLVALHMAASSLWDSSADAALVAGVLLSLVPQSTLMVQRAGMLAPDGRCKVLDAAADGYVRGEACRAMWLEAAPAAGAGVPAEGSTALAVVLGTAVNTNGKASSLTAPHGPTQQALIAAALGAAGMAATEVSGLQMHANGTSLGDPIEVGAVVPAYQLAQAGSTADSSSSSRPAFVFSTIKGYAGHSEAAAGAVGVLEAVSVMVQQALAPALHVRELNPYIAAPLQGRNAVLNRSTGLAPVPIWQQQALSSPGAAGAQVAMAVSSFGAQGTNAHAILGHNHQWALNHSSIASAAGARGQLMPQQQLAWQEQRFWVAPVYQRLISRALVTRADRGKRASGLKVAFEARLDAAGLAGSLWSYLSTPTEAGHTAQPFLCNSLLLAAAASAGSLLAGSGSSAQQQALVLHNAVLAPPQMLPASPGQPGLQLPALLVAVHPGTGSCVIEVAGQRQLQCLLALTDTADTTAGEASSSSLTSRLAGLLGIGLQAAVTAAASSASPGVLVGAHQRQPHLQVVSNLSPADSSSNDGFVLHPASLEGCLQSCMVTSGQATALWLSSLQALTVPLEADGPAGGGWVAANCVHAADGSSCQVDSLSMYGSSGVCRLSVTGALLAADATTATEAAATIAEAAAGVTSEAAAAAALSAVTAAANHLLQLDEAERGLYLQAQIMSEVRVIANRAVLCLCSLDDRPCIAMALKI